MIGLLLTGGLSLSALPLLLVYLLIILIVVSVIYWLINSFAPEPIKRYAIAVVVVIAVICLIYFLLQIVGGSSPLH